MHSFLYTRLLPFFLLHSLHAPLTHNLSISLSFLVSAVTIVFSYYSMVSVCASMYEYVRVCLAIINANSDSLFH